MKSHALVQDDTLLGEIRGLIEQAPQHVAQTANSALTLLHWRLGARIQREILPLKQPLEREYYAALCGIERWSVRTQSDRRGSPLYLRTAIAKKPEAWYWRESPSGLWPHQADPQ
jgi:hypothetical protein